MDEYGYMRVAACAPRVGVAAVRTNVEQIKLMARRAWEAHARLTVMPELCVTGYTCGDLFLQQSLINAARRALTELAAFTKSVPGMALAIGLPLTWRGALYNCAAVMQDGELHGVVAKTYLPNYSEFYEKRWFASGGDLPDNAVINIDGKDLPFGTDLLFRQEDAVIGVELCEDLWTPLPPSTLAALSGATVIANLSATNEVIGKHQYLTRLIEGQSARLHAAYIYASAGHGESSTDLVYSGNAIICENGKTVAASPRFKADELMEVADIDLQLLERERMAGGSFGDNAARMSLPDFRIVELPAPQKVEITPATLLREIDPAPFVPHDKERRAERCEEIINIQSEGLMKRLRHTGARSLVVGVSGGLDSTLALLVASRAFERLGLDPKGIIGVTMPGFGTTDRTYTNALTLIRRLGATLREVPIAPAVRQHFSDIGHDEKVHDLTYENSQARERTQILMDIAGAEGGFVLGTGDLSELALGWCTYNADHMSMYGVNASVPKTLVRHLVEWVADDTDNEELRTALRDVADTPVSPELLPPDADGNIAQKTEDLVGPYPLHDFFLYYLLRHGFTPRKILLLACKAFDGQYSEEVIRHWLDTFYRRFFSQQFKRSCLPDGPKVGSVCLSPRGDWRMPSDATREAFISKFE